MNILKKVYVALLIFFMMCLSLPQSIVSGNETHTPENKVEDETYYIVSLDENVHLYDAASESANVIIDIPSFSEVTIITEEQNQADNEFSLVEFISENDHQTYIGYVKNTFISTEPISSDHTSIIDESDAVDSIGVDITEEQVENNLKTSLVVQSTLNLNTAQKSLRGIALNSPTHVYSNQSTGSTVLRSYSQGSVLKYRTLNSNWYEATVKYNGEWTTGYIHKSHVENAVDTTESLNGIALNSPTSVFSRASVSSSALRTYPEGTLLKYKTFTDNWYEATVKYNGQWTTGYIHKNHVESPTSSPETLNGVALHSETKIYSRASTSAPVLRTYPQGSVLKYRTFTKNWYEATIKYNGKWTTGYIHRNHVENSTNSPETLNGIALESNTKIFSRASISAPVLRSYPEGTILKYKTFTDNWYEATVRYNGQWTTGYIHKNHVENPTDSPETLNGIALNSQTKVYSRASTSAPALRSYPEGTILKYKTFSNNWYEATVRYNNQWTTGYIYKQHVESISNVQERINGYAAKTKTHVYERASKNSKVLKSYNLGSSMIFNTFSSNWYEAVVYVDGVRKIGYIYHDDIEFKPIVEIKYTNYNYTFSSMVDIQLTRSPKADGKGTIAAGRNLIEYYANPSNFPQGNNGFYQFLVLSSPAHLNVNEVNKNILDSSKGTLAGTARAFSEAANLYGINEAYLIAHALHETGNGTSQLAQGVTINGKKVYNMFGTAAYDGTAVSSGAQYAYDKGWFTPEAAIIGGAQFVAKNYIHAGQDTLYKMRWNPDNPGHHQYATHVAWAQITTNRIASIYDQLDFYVQKFEVPRFQNQPGYAGPNPPKNDLGFSTFSDKAVGTTTGTNVRFRTQPSTGSDSTIISSIANSGTTIELLGTNNMGWYKAKYNGKEGWISADYVNPLNVLEISASGLNVRQSPSAQSESLGVLPNGTIVSGVLDNKNNLVTSNEWYKIYYQNTEAWISSGSKHQYIQIR